MGFAAKVIQVIVTDDLRGRGIESDPFRRVTQYFTLDGELLAEVDTCKGPQKATGHMVLPGGK